MPNHTSEHFEHYLSLRFSSETNAFHQNLKQSQQNPPNFWQAFWTIIGCALPKLEQAESGVGGGQSPVICAEA